MSSEIVPNSDAAAASCRKNKKDDGTFFENVKDHIDELVHSPWKDHVSCFKTKMNKMFDMSKLFGQKNSEAQQTAESGLPLQTTSTSK